MKRFWIGLTVLVLATSAVHGRRWIPRIVAAVAGCSIFDDFSGSLSWDTHGRGQWTNTVTPGTYTVLAGDGAPTYAGGDGDAYTIFNGCTNTYDNVWVEVKLSTYLSGAGYMGGPLMRVSQSTIGLPANNGAWGWWLAFNPNDQAFYLQKFTNDIWCCTIGTMNNGGVGLNIATNHYLGVELINNRTNLICKVYDNGTSHVDWTTGWTNLLGELEGVNGNATIVQTEGKYEGLGYGCVTRTFPANQYDDFRSGSFDAYQVDTLSHFTNNTSPVTASLTCNASSTLLIVGIACANGSTVRAGGAPTYNGVAMTQAGSTQKAASSPEGSAELWYLISPTTGSSQTISIPNTGSAPIYAEASSWIAPNGRTAALDQTSGSNGTSANPSLALTPTVTGALVYGVMFNGRDTAATANNRVNLNRTDEGAFSDSNQYTIIGQPGATTFSWTVASDDWAINLASFK
jgi:hypothetical protein